MFSVRALSVLLLSALALACLAIFGIFAAPSSGRASPRGTEERVAPVEPVEVLPPAPLPAEPATEAAARVMETLEGIRSNLQETRYQHRTVVNERRGRYLWDCSGMADWVLARTAPRAHRELRRERPVASTFFRVIDRAPTDEARRGWRKLPHMEDARPGDVFAWLRPPDWPRRNTGHVGFVIDRPRPVPRWPGYYSVRIADATSVPHQDDSRSWPGEGGYGEGTIVWMTDGSGTASAYGWHGIFSRGVVETRAVFGRVTR